MIAWFGWGVKWPVVEDAHITLAFIPDVEDIRIQTDYNMERVNGDTLGAVAKRFVSNYPKRFTVALMGQELFYKADVVTVELPPLMAEAALFFRYELFRRGIPFEKTYGFIPHITYGYRDENGDSVEPYYDHSLGFPNTYEVNTFFVVYGNERHTFKLEK